MNSSLSLGTGQCAFCAVLTKTNFTGEKLAKQRAKHNTASALFSNCVKILKFFPQLLKVFSSPYCASRRCKQRGGGRKNFDRSFFAELHVWSYLQCQIGRTTTAIHLRLCDEDFFFQSSKFRNPKRYKGASSMASSFNLSIHSSNGPSNITIFI